MSDADLAIRLLARVLDACGALRERPAARIIEEHVLVFAIKEDVAGFRALFDARPARFSAGVQARLASFYGIGEHPGPEAAKGSDADLYAKPRKGSPADPEMRERQRVRKRWREQDADRARSGR